MNDQPQYEPRAVARRTDPETSWEAADSVEHIRRSQSEVLAIIRRDGPLTDEEIASRYVGMQSPSGLRTRRHELVLDGILFDTGRRKKGLTGRNMVVWGEKDDAVNSGVPNVTPLKISPLRGNPQPVAKGRLEFGIHSICDYCNGKGERHGKTCGVCDGRGWR